MKVIIPLVFDYDAQQWARTFDIGVADAARDFAAVLRRAVHDGAVSAAIDAHWPMMRGHVTAHTVDGLDAVTRDELLDLLRQARDADQDDALISLIRQYLADHPQDLDGRAPRWIVLHAMEWDDGYFLSGGLATVYFTDGDSVPYEIDSDAVEDLLTDMFGARGAAAALGVDLSRERMEFDDYADNVPSLLGIPPRSPDGGDRAGDDTERTIAGESGVLVPIAPSREIVTYRPDAARRWLAEGVADEFGIDESFATEEITIAARLGDLLRSLADDPHPQVWRLHPPATGVYLWRTAYGDGIDGGALLTADLHIGVHDVNLAIGHIAFDEFTDDARTSGIDAAVEALGLIAHRVNQAVTRILQATGTPQAGQSAA
ncbi:hypothetical protein EDC02_7691 [Micromonospora sp. Llam0]|uniref:hypothetical protein n=1 Tax=Micromonospora sp. Llam0 TaxID=2485143 RepID=UPI000F484AD8|nr:hypothetical protein [Micromonospora sp. Llam0]ROO52750.1 hypothetical protein EDC02_7691 [Micromonospora sp. Llam0]